MKILIFLVIAGSHSLERFAFLPKKVVRSNDRIFRYHYQDFRSDRRDCQVDVSVCRQIGGSLYRNSDKTVTQPFSGRRPQGTPESSLDVSRLDG